MPEALLSMNTEQLKISLAAAVAVAVITFCMAPDTDTLGAIKTARETRGDSTAAQQLSLAIKL